MVDNETFDSLSESCEELFEIVEKLKEQNAFLTDTIEKNNLEQISSERKELLARAEDGERKSKKADLLVSEYKNKIAAVEKRSSEIDDLIDTEAEKRIKEVKKEYARRYQEDKQRLQEKEKEMSNRYREKAKRCAILSAVCIVLCISICFLMRMF